MKKSILTLFAVMFLTSANADTKCITPQEFAQSISEVPSKVSSAVKNEWEKTMEFQKKSWNETKQKWPWNKIFKGDNAS